MYMMICAAYNNRSCCRVKAGWSELYQVRRLDYMKGPSMNILMTMFMFPGLDTIKITIHSSCEIEYFVETHLCKLCVILRSRVLRVVDMYYTDPAIRIITP